MKLALTLEADSINVQALNMGRIVVDVDGVTLAELINVVCDNGYSLRVVDESDRTSAERTPPSAALTGIRCSNRENITIHLDEHIQSVQGKESYEDEMFSIKYFKKGSAHITFRKPELVDRLNEIIAKHYPGVLPS